MRSFGPALVIFLYLACDGGATTPKKPHATVPPETCPSRTVNYITHVLPQQCLPTSRNASIASTPTTIATPPHTASSESGSTTAPMDAATRVAVHHSKANDTQASTLLQSTDDPVASPASSQPDLTSVPPASPLPATAGTGDGVDEDSPLGDGKFLSFEDWKRENLKKAGQWEHLGKGHGLQQRDPRKRPPVDPDSLDYLGDDAEIDLDFSAFVGEGLASPRQDDLHPVSPVAGDPTAVSPGQTPEVRLRSKDAGTTYKERFNYASFDCAANVLKTNPEAKGAAAVLGKNKDSYMLNECSAQNKFLILELCDDISIDTIVVANFEFFSSTFRTFHVSVSDKYPVKIDKWKSLGTFEARNTRDLQAFLVENPVIWARYLRIEFLTHYGHEYYCPVSLVRVHGTTMLEDYKHDLDGSKADGGDGGPREADDVADMDGLVPEAVADALLKPSNAVEPAATIPLPDTPSGTVANQSHVEHASANATCTSCGHHHPSTCPAAGQMALRVLSDSDLQLLEMCHPLSHAPNETVAPKHGRPSTPTTDDAATAGPVHNPVSSVASSRERQDAISTSTGNAITSAASTTVGGDPPSTSGDQANTTNTLSSSTISNSTKSPSSATSSLPPVPTMQESFFKSVQKRLQMLETNSSLSLQYIEEQSRALRDAFQKVEQRQLSKTTSFLEYLNTTVLNELREFRQQYDQLWQSTVIELEMQRERYQQETLNMNARLGVLADEVIFQKRMSILQMILVLICLGLVLLSKDPLNHSWGELPLVQHMLARSPSSRLLSISGLDTPSRSPAVTRANSTGGVRKRHGILKGHSQAPSEASMEIEAATESVEMYSPPTPVSIGGSPEEPVEELRLEDPQLDPMLIERPNTSPPVLTGDRDSPSPEAARASDEPTKPVRHNPHDYDFDTTPAFSSARESPSAKHLTWRLPDG